MKLFLFFERYVFFHMKKNEKELLSEKINVSQYQIEIIKNRE
ncbi:hypothetical protein PROPEN_04362 [Proteus penneri ATCC 35198]|nr:hypothetical protein PROPEN_04362 [Proteus penneri ATCC 35198]